MARACQICEKSKQFGHAVSHARNRSPRVFKPNLHTARIAVGGERVKLILCSKCLRKIKGPNKFASKKTVTVTATASAL